MPLTAKGSEIKSAMTKEYGEKKGESVFYASRNSGRISGVDCTDKLKGIADAVAMLANGARSLEERMDKRRSDASKEFHDLESSFANKAANKALESGDHDMAKKWVDYGTEHAKQSEAKTERMEGPPDDKAKKDKKADSLATF